MAGNPTDSSENEHRGIAYEAKVAIYDVGTSDGAGLNVPADLADMFEPAYRAGEVR